MKETLEKLNILYILYEVKIDNDTGKEFPNVVEIVLHNDARGTRNVSKIRSTQNYRVLYIEDMNKLTDDKQWAIVYAVYTHISARMKEEYVERAVESAYNTYTLSGLINYLEVRNLKIHFRFCEIDYQLRKQDTEEVVIQGTIETVLEFVDRDKIGIDCPMRNRNLLDYLSFEDFDLWYEPQVVDLNTMTRFRYK